MLVLVLFMGLGVRREKEDKIGDRENRERTEVKQQDNERVKEVNKTKEAKPR